MGNWGMATEGIFYIPDVQCDNLLRNYYVELKTKSIHRG